MGRFAPKYSQNQKDAVVYACLDDGMNSAEAARAAAAGQLPGCRPFTIPAATIRHYKKAAERKRWGADLKDSAKSGLVLDKLTTEMLEAAVTEWDRIKRQPGPLNVIAMRNLARTIKELRTVQPRRPRPKPTSRATSTDVVDALARQLAAQDNGTQGDDKTATRDAAQRAANKTLAERAGETLGFDPANYPKALPEHAEAAAGRLSPHAQSTHDVPTPQQAE